MKSEPEKKYWSQFLSLPLWQLIVLSLDIEPRSLMSSEVFAGEFHGWQNTEKKQAYVERLNIASNHMQQGNLKIFGTRYRYSYLQPAQIREFVSWTQNPTIKWNIPKWLKSLAVKTEQPTVTKTTNMKEEKTWAKLLAVVLTMEPFDYSQPHRAANIIQAHAKTIGIDLGERTIADKIKMISSIKKSLRLPEPQINE